MRVAQQGSTEPCADEGRVTGTSEETWMRIGQIFASPNAPSSLVARLRPLLAGLISRSKKLHQSWSPRFRAGIVYELEWTRALKQHVNPDGRSPCGNSACSVFATDEAPHLACSRCRWVRYCSPACLVRSHNRRRV